MNNRYKVSEEFKESCKANIGLKRHGRIHVVEDNLDIEGENYGGQLVDFTIEDNCYVDNTFIGTTVAKKITVNIINPNNEINLENKKIEAYTGIALESKLLKVKDVHSMPVQDLNQIPIEYLSDYGILEEIPYGTYIIEKPENEEAKQKTSFVGYDYMIKFNVPYIHDDSIIYPIKLSSLLEKLCKQVGLELGSTDFTNADYMVLGNPFTNNEDCRTVLSNIAQLAGGFAKIGRDNKVYIKTLKKAPTGLLKVKDVHNMPIKDLHIIPVGSLASYRDSADDYIDGNNYFEDFAKNNTWGEVNSLVIGLSDIEGENTARTDEESITKNGLTEIKIEDNYFLINEEERTKVIEQLWESLKGIHYLPFKTKYYGYPHLDAGDIIAIDDVSDIQYVSYVFNHTFTFNGAFSGNIETIAMTKTQTAYKNTQDVKSKFKRVERSVDKINGEIEDIIEFEDETTQQLSQHKQTMDSITDTVSKVQTNLQNNYYTKTETKSQITQTANSITSEVSKNIKDAKEEVLEQANSKITQTADNITSEVNKKVGNDELGSKIQQNWESIQIAWNQISQYIQFKNAKLQILDSNNKLLLSLDSNGFYLYDTDGIKNKMMLDRSGQRFYESGEYIGKIGTNQLHGYSDKKDLTFDLDRKGSFMDWACLDNDSDTNYTMKLWYARPNTGTLHEGLCLGTDLITNGHVIDLGNNTFTAIWNNGGTGIRTEDKFTIGDMMNSTYFSIDDGKVNCYKDLDMHGYNIINAGNGASDGRLKKSIYTSNINAIDRIKQMKHRQFKWKKDNKQEEIGYIAQEMEKIDENYITHNYKEDNEGNVIQDSYEMRILPILATATKAIQEQQQVIEKQQKQINMLMEKLNIQQDIPIVKENFIEESETIFNGEAKYEENQKLEETQKYETKIRYLENGEIEIIKELEKER